MNLAWEKNRLAHVEHYSESVDQFGHTIGAVGWGSPESQQIRFQVLTEIGVYPRASVLDIGCGMGDLYDYLDRHFHVGEGYLGIDITPRMVEAAKARYPAGRFIADDILNPRTSIPRADFVLASGIFALLKLDLDPYRIMTDLIVAMFNLCKEGLAFNSLSSWTPHPEPDKFFVDPEKALRICREMTQWVTLRHDYLPHDFTVYMYRGQKRILP
jgi:SAM-dependent methyltransferase